MKMTVSINLQKIFDNLLAFFVVVGTLFFIPYAQGSPLDAISFGYLSQELFFRYGAFLVFGVSLFLKPLRNSDLKWLGIFLVYSFLSIFLYGYDNRIAQSVLNILSGVLFVKTVADHADYKNLKVYCYWFLGLIVLNLATCLQQYFKHDPLFQIPAALGRLDSMSGFMRHKVHLGALASLLSPFLFYISPILLVLSIPMICVSNSSTAVVAFILSIGLLAFFRITKRTFILLSVLLLLAGAFYVYKYDLPGGSFGERFKVWDFTYSQGLKRHAFLGSGAGSFIKLRVATNQPTADEALLWEWAHNEYVQAFYEFGVYGLAVIFFYIKSCVCGFLKNYQDRKLQILFSSFLVVLAVSFFHFPFHIARLAIPCLFVMGMFHGRLKDLDAC